MAVKSRSVSPGVRSELTAVEREIIQFFVQLAGSLSIPKSVGEIFGLLFCAAQPLPFEAIVASLGVSKGSASQGLRTLQKIGAIQTVYIARDRRTFYRAETSMRKLVTGLLNETVRPRLDGNESHLERITLLLEGDGKSAPDHIQERIASLQSWNHKARRLLPWLVKLTAPKPDS